MKKDILFIWLILVFLTGNLFAQEIDNPICGTKSWTPDEVERLPFYKNSQWLITQGRKKGIPIPENYLETITDQNRGRSLASYSWATGLKDEEGIDKNIPEGEISNQSFGRPSGPIPTTISYLKVRAFVWANSSGTRAISDAGIRQIISEVNQIYINNAVPISFF